MQLVSQKLHLLVEFKKSLTDKAGGNSNLYQLKLEVMLRNIILINVLQTLISIAIMVIFNPPILILPTPPPQPLSPHHSNHIMHTPSYQSRALMPMYQPKESFISLQNLTYMIFFQYKS